MKVPGDAFVPTKINGLETKPPRIAPGSAVRLTPETASGKGGEIAAESTDVHVTGAARNLAALEQSLRSLPAIDELRVAAVKQRLQEGRYEIDPQRVADRLLRLDSDLANASPVDAAKLG